MPHIAKVPVVHVGRFLRLATQMGYYAASSDLCALNLCFFRLRQSPWWRRRLALVDGELHKGGQGLLYYFFLF
jgi:hypothetical protein